MVVKDDEEFVEVRLPDKFVPPKIIDDYFKRLERQLAKPRPVNVRGMKAKLTEIKKRVPKKDKGCI